MTLESLRTIIKKEWRLPYENKVARVINAFSLTEKVIFLFFVVIFFVSSLSLLWQVNKSFLVEVPDYGGTLSEGVVGPPRFVNPLLAVSDTDRDLTSLIYSGLLKVGGDGALTPDLAKSYTISDDSLVYTFVLKDDIYFHDGTAVTADDVVFTIEKTQDPILKSPRKANWSGVEVKKIDDKTVTFTLKQPYSPFIQNMTLGILPKHIWSTATSEEFPFSQFNIQPIGSGPYKIDSIGYTSSGFPSEYHLTANKEYALGRAYITSVVIKSYSNEKDLVDAYKNGDIESVHGLTPGEIPNLSVQKENVLTAPLPRVFGVFFNQSVAPVFLNKEVRQALDMVTDKQEIVDAVLGGYGQPIDGPIPPKEIAQNGKSPTVTEEKIASAQALLVSKGWKQNANGIFEKKDKTTTTTLSFSISTGDAPELKATAELLQKQWQKLGAKVEVKIFEIGDLNQNIIRPRKYDALLFGEIIGRDLDLYPFWHSSQRTDPGLNIALYTNLKADKIIENIRKTTEEDIQQTLYDNFTAEIAGDVPAVFTYSPYFIYIVPTKVQNISLGELSSPSERFDNIAKWYIETNSVWRIFIK